jgi:hypothetical protein
MSEIKGINDIISPEVWEAILTSCGNLERALNAALAQFEVRLIKGSTLSQMVKQSPQYWALEGKRGEQAGFMNKVKSTAKALYLGERSTFEAAKSLEDSINQVLEPYEVIFTPGKSLSQMVKGSPVYQRMTDARDRSRFFNEVNSKLRGIDKILTVEVVFLMRLVSSDAMRPSGENRGPAYAAMGNGKPRESINALTQSEKNRGPVYTVVGMEKPRGVPPRLWTTIKQQGLARGTVCPKGVSGNAWVRMVNGIIKHNQRLGFVPKFGDPMKAWAHERELMRWRSSDKASRQQKK